LHIADKYPLVKIAAPNEKEIQSQNLQEIASSIINIKLCLVALAGICHYYYKLLHQV
jgi:hypothetical protein